MKLTITLHLFCRELIRMKSQGGSYFWEVWTWIELCNISLLTACNISFMSLKDKNVEENDINRGLLVATSSISILQLVRRHYGLYCNLAVFMYLLILH